MSLLHRLFRRHESRGARGERLAASYLRARGFRILERNLHVHDDEADLVALDPDGTTVVLVEVKTRSNDGIAPEASVNQRKRQHLVRMAMKLQQQPSYRDRPFRFDVVAVVMPENGDAIVRHIPAAFVAQ